MTIASTNVATSGSTGNGVTTSFSFSFNLDPNGYGATSAASQVQVIRETIATGAEEILTLTTDYSVSVNADQSSAPGGSITMVTAPSSAYKIWVRLNPDFTQQTDLGNQSPFNAQSIEDQMDQQARQILVLKDQVRRAPRVGVQAGSSFDGEITGDLTAGAWPSLKSDLSGYQWTTNCGSATAVTATGSTTARTLADRFADGVNVKDYGALGDGVTDDYAAIQAAINAVDTGLGGTVFFPKGVYIVSQPLTASSFGVILKGAGKSATTLSATHSSGPVYRWKRSLCEVHDMTIDASGARLSGDSVDHGLQGMSNDTAGHAVASSVLRNVRVLNQPGVAIHLVGAVSMSHLENCHAEDCGGHPLLIESGESLGRTNNVQPGQVFVSQFRGIDCGGNFAIGDPDDTLEAYRCVVNDCELIDCATDAGVRFSAHGFYIRGNNMAVHEIAAGAASTPSGHLCVLLWGENVYARNIRVINCDANAITVHHTAGYNTKGVILDGQRVIGSGTQNPLITVTSGAVNVEAYNRTPANITSLMTAGVTGGYIVFNNARTVADSHTFGGTVAVSSNVPRFQITDTDNNETSYFQSSANAARISVDSANAVASSNFTIDVDGVDVADFQTGGITFSKAVTIDDGGNTTNGFILQGAIPTLNIVEDDATSDEGYWRAAASGDQLIIQSRTSANGAGVNGVTFDRSGTAFNYAAFAMEIRPATDDLYDVGNASFRFDDVYATNGTIQTSDAREKNAAAVNS
jgi:hypothetical protein